MTKQQLIETYNTTARDLHQQAAEEKIREDRFQGLQEKLQDKGLHYWSSTHPSASERTVYLNASPPNSENAEKIESIRQDVRVLFPDAEVTPIVTPYQLAFKRPPSELADMLTPQVERCQTPSSTRY